MVHILVRKVEATNMFFSSWILVFFAVGIIIEEWAELKLGPQKPTITHSPWICCTSLWNIYRGSSTWFTVLRVPSIKVVSILKTKIPVGIGEFRGVCTR